MKTNIRLKSTPQTVRPTDSPARMGREGDTTADAGTIAVCKQFGCQLNAAEYHSQPKLYCSPGCRYKAYHSRKFVAKSEYDSLESTASTLYDTLRPCREWLILPDDQKSESTLRQLTAKTQQVLAEAQAIILQATSDMRARPPCLETNFRSAESAE